jgi:hypothetical protein
MYININLAPKKRVREYAGLSLTEQLIGGLIGSGLGVGLVYMMVTAEAERDAQALVRTPSVCEKLIALAETREDSLRVLTTPIGNGTSCAAELLP